MDQNLAMPLVEEVFNRLGSTFFRKATKSTTQGRFQFIDAIKATIEVDEDLEDAYTNLSTELQAQERDLLLDVLRQFRNSYNPTDYSEKDLCNALGHFNLINRSGHVFFSNGVWKDWIADGCPNMDVSNSASDIISGVAGVYKSYEVCVDAYNKPAAQIEGPLIIVIADDYALHSVQGLEVTVQGNRLTVSYQLCVKVINPDLAFVMGVPNA